MQNLIVVSQPEDWDLDVDGVHVVRSREYLADGALSRRRGVRVFNLARSYRYQRTGYYVSLLAEARGHRPIPSVETIQDLKSRAVLRMVSDELLEQIRRSLAPIQSPDFTLSVYFGRNVARRHDRLAGALFRQFRAPLLRARFARDDAGEWELAGLDTIGIADVPEAHREFLRQVAREFFAARARPARRRTSGSYDLAILVNPDEPDPPSDARAIRRMVRAASRTGLAAEVIGPEDLGRIAEFDALFLRETTAVNHRTFRAARRAEGLGLVVIDDPASILRCTNKVFLAELLARHGVPHPHSMIVHRHNRDRVIDEIGLPAVLKQPDSAFSRGVVKVESPEELDAATTRLLGSSDLFIAQEYLPTDYDWRVGVLDGRPLYACRYFMARSHWQIVKRGQDGDDRWGAAETVAVEDAPPTVVATAVAAARLIGDGLYGVDLKERGDGAVVIEVNDNPNLDAGYEDAVLRDELYLALMRTFLERIRRRKDGRA